MNLRFLSFVSRYMMDWFLSPARWRERTGLPVVLNLPITDNCNSRCVMCDVWKTKSTGELSVSDLKEILSDSLFARIAHVGISGGEPTLRSDLVEIVAALVATLPRLMSLSITSHGFHSSRWNRFLPSIQDICQKRGIGFTLNLSLDGIGELHDEVRQIPGAYRQVLRTHEIAKQLGVKVKFQSTISKPNLYGMTNTLGTTLTMGTEVDFRLATEIHRLENSVSMKKITLEQNEKSFLADFLASRSLLQNTKSPARRLFYRDLSNRLVNNSVRKAPCYYQHEGVLLTPHGDLYHCSISRVSLGNIKDASPHELYFSERNERLRRELIKHVCPGCVHDQSGAWSPYSLLKELIRQSKIGGLMEKVYPFLKTLLMSSPDVLRMLFRRRIHHRVSGKIKKVVCIGMYGGEHAGDAAILGGVLLRLHRTYGLEEAYVSSFRPDRTRRWTESLRLPVKVMVISGRETVSYINICDALVLAGGPVMDIPEILLKQLSYLNHSLASRIPFLVEGVGIGPFKNRFTQWLARLILRKASTISVRTTDDSRHALVADLQPVVLPDPAFDYIQSKGLAGDLPTNSQESFKRLNSLLEADSIKIGLNLRPLWEKYNFALGTSDNYQSAFLFHFSKSLVDLRRSMRAPMDFYFFPMNADQFGFSDFHIAHQLKNLLPSNFSLHIWESEPDVGELIRFLRQMDAVIAMRFHAVIFALSQNIPLVGIDYTLGRDGKVGKLLREAKQEINVCRVDTFDGMWMVGRVTELLGKTPRSQPV